MFIVQRNSSKNLSLNRVKGSLKFEAECQKLRSMFSKLKYSKDLVNSIVSAFFKSKLLSEPSPPVEYEQPPIRIVLPFKDQKSADVLRKQLDSLDNKIGTSLQPVYASRKLRDVLSVKEPKSSEVNQQGVVYRFKCPLCDSEYIGFTTRHLFQGLDEHLRSATSH